MIKYYIDNRWWLDYYHWYYMIIDDVYMEAFWVMGVPQIIQVVKPWLSIDTHGWTFKKHGPILTCWLYLTVFTILTPFRTIPKFFVDGRGRFGACRRMTCPRTAISLEVGELQSMSNANPPLKPGQKVSFLLRTSISGYIKYQIVLVRLPYICISVSSLSVQIVMHSFVVSWLLQPIFVCIIAIVVCYPSNVSKATAQLYVSLHVSPTKLQEPPSAVPVENCRNSLVAWRHRFCCTALVLSRWSCIHFWWLETPEMVGFLTHLILHVWSCLCFFHWSDITQVSFWSCERKTTFQSRGNAQFQPLLSSGVTHDISRIIIHGDAQTSHAPSYGRQRRGNTAWRIGGAPIFGQQQEFHVHNIRTYIYICIYVYIYVYIYT
jgi:hypothetical protein